MRWNGQIFWLLASNACAASHLLPAFTPELLSGTGLIGKSYPVTAAQLLPIFTGFLAPIHFFQARKELGPRTSRLRFKRQGYLISCLLLLLCRARSLGMTNNENLYMSKLPSSDSNRRFIITGGAGFIGSNLTLALQEKFPDARLTVIDDFRSGNFKNLVGYGGDLVARNLATLDWREQFSEETFDAIFHLASITDTTNHDQV